MSSDCQSFKVVLPNTLDEVAVSLLQGYIGYIKEFDKSEIHFSWITFAIQKGALWDIIMPPFLLHVRLPLYWATKILFPEHVGVYFIVFFTTNHKNNLLVNL